MKQLIPYALITGAFLPGCQEPPFKPSLSDVAGDLAEEMIESMPH